MHKHIQSNVYQYFILPTDISGTGSDHFARHASCELFSHSLHRIQQTLCIFTQKEEVVWPIQGYLNSTVVSPFGAAVNPIIQPSEPVRCLYLCHAFLVHGEFLVQHTSIQRLPPLCTLMGPRGLERHKQKKTQFNFPLQVQKTSITTVPGPMHNSLVVMCVLNAAEIYMASYANLAALWHAVLAKQTTREQHATKTAPIWTHTVCTTECQPCNFPLCVVEAEAVHRAAGKCVTCAVLKCPSFAVGYLNCLQRHTPL